jgi:hypothetical protein
MMFFFGGSFLSNSPLRRFGNVLVDTFLVSTPVLGAAVLVVAIYKRNWVGITYSVGYIFGLVSMGLLVLFWRPEGGF